MKMHKSRIHQENGALVRLEKTSSGGMTRASRDALASRCLDAALALTESAARHDFRGPDPFDGLWWHGPACWSAGVVAGKPSCSCMPDRRSMSAGSIAAATR